MSQNGRFRQQSSILIVKHSLFQVIISVFGPDKNPNSPVYWSTVDSTVNLPSGKRGSKIAQALFAQGKGVGGCG